MACNSFMVTHASFVHIRCSPCICFQLHLQCNSVMYFKLYLHNHVYFSLGSSKVIYMKFIFNIFFLCANIQIGIYRGLFNTFIYQRFAIHHPHFCFITIVHDVLIIFFFPLFFSPNQETHIMWIIWNSQYCCVYIVFDIHVR